MSAKIELDLPEGLYTWILLRAKTTGRPVGQRSIRSVVIEAIKAHRAEIEKSRDES